MVMGPGLRRDDAIPQGASVPRMPPEIKAACAGTTRNSHQSFNFTSLWPHRRRSPKCSMRPNFPSASIRAPNISSLIGRLCSRQCLVALPITIAAFCRRDVRMEKMIASRSATDTDFGSFTSFHRKSLLMVGGSGGGPQFWILRVDQLQHLKMQTMFQIHKGLMNICRSSSSSSKMAAPALWTASSIARAGAVEFFSLASCPWSRSPRPGWLGGLEQIKNTLASL